MLKLLEQSKAALQEKTGEREFTGEKENRDGSVKYLCHSPAVPVLFAAMFSIWFPAKCQGVSQPPCHWLDIRTGLADINSQASQKITFFQSLKAHQSPCSHLFKVRQPITRATPLWLESCLCQRYGQPVAVIISLPFLLHSPHTIFRPRSNVTICK